MPPVETYGGRRQSATGAGYGLLRETRDAASSGAAVGAALQQGAGALGAVSRAAMVIRDEEDRARVAERVNNYSDMVRERTYDPDKGYLTLRGKDAVDGRQRYADTLEEMRVEQGDGLNERQMRMYTQASQSRQRQGLDAAIRHASSERRSWLVSVSTARVRTLADDALATYQNPDTFRLNIAAGVAELDKAGELAGWSPEELALRKAEHVSGVHSAVVSQMAPADPLGAKAWLDDHKDRVTAQAYAQLDAGLAAPVRAATAIEIADGIDPADIAPTRVNATGAVDARRRTNSRVDAAEGSPYAALQDALGDVLVADAAPGPVIKIDVRGMTDSERADIVRKAQAAGYGGVGFGSGTITVDEGEPRVWADGGGVPDYATDLVPDVPERDGYTGPLNIEQKVAAIKDPLLREEVAQQLSRREGRRDAQLRRTERAAQIKAEKFIIANPNVNPVNLPIEVRQELGLNGFNAMVSYYDKTSAGVNIKTDEPLYAQLERMAATNPEQFAREVDLFEHIDQLDTEDRRRLQTIQADILKAERVGGVKRSETLAEFRTLSSIMGVADTQLDAAGLDDPEERALFQRSLVTRTREWQAENKRKPNDAEVLDIVDGLMLPVVFKRPGWLGTKTRKGRVFEAPARQSTETVDTPNYVDLPDSTRLAIEQELAIDLGRTPTKAEVTAEYGAMFLGR